ncbi:MAG: hypothetical protein B7Z12_06995 [Caulobacter vibrioides]|uniref:Cell division protein n=1 Tax=Caulobacter vibrioides TaxID=155892 RepID=A0A258D940_CAUVI|nr:MAG: hypothetical protein B7Z12_06995 [Caulobacter vibrioides]
MNVLRTLFNRRLRGFRVIEVVACGCLAVLVLSVYMTKASAGREASAIAGINQDIATEQKRLRLLKAELAHLEQPQRLERLSTQYLALAPVPARRETVPDGLTEVARQAGAERSVADASGGAR